MFGFCREILFAEANKVENAFPLFKRFEVFREDEMGEGVLKFSKKIKEIIFIILAQNLVQSGAFIEVFLGQPLTFQSHDFSLRNVRVIDSTRNRLVLFLLSFVVFFLVLKVIFLRFVLKDFLADLFINALNIGLFIKVFLVRMIELVFYRIEFSECFFRDIA